MSAAGDICVYLENLGHTSIFLNTVPVAKTTCICVYDTGGYEPIRYHGACQPLDRPTIQIRIRDACPATAREIAYEIYAELDGMSNVEINGTEYISLNAAGTPTYIGTDQVSIIGQAHEWTLNLYSIKKRS